MRVYIVGVDGYLGWSLASYLAAHGHVVGGMDNLSRRSEWVPEMGSDSMIPISSPSGRLSAFRVNFGSQHLPDAETYIMDAKRFDTVSREIQAFVPDCIVNLAHMPSAPYSMIDFDHCLSTHLNNMQTTLTVLWVVKESMPQVPILTIGSAGEYGTPNVEIAEGFFTLEYKGRSTVMPFPRMMPASLYHATKCHSSIDLERACAWWDLKVTDIMQSVVYGTRHDHMGDNVHLKTRFDVDDAFGTAINRFVAQAIVGHPLTVYGAGAQKRGFLPLRDSMECIRLLVETPPQAGQYRVVNQYDQIYTISELASAVQSVGAEHFGLDVEVENLENPRYEEPEHYYNVERNQLLALGYVPRGELENELRMMFEDLLPYKGRIEKFKSAILPRITWKNGRV